MTVPKGVRKTPPQPWPAHGWEYRDVSVGYVGSWADALNELGRDGWYVVAVVHDEDPEGDNDEVRVLLVRPGDRRFRAPKAAPSLDGDGSTNEEEEEEEET